MPVDDARDVVAIAISARTPTSQEDIKAAESFRVFRDRILEKDKLLRGPQVAPEATTYKDTLSEPLEPDQVAGILNGDGRLHLYIWAGWKTLDGNSADLGECLSLVKPKSAEINPGNITDWALCSF